MTAREMKREPKSERGGRGRGRKETSSFLPHPLPALLLAPLFSRSLGLVPRSFLLNRTETLATQARREEAKAGGTRQSFYTERLRPEVQTLTLLLTILDRKGTPFVYLSLLLSFFHVWFNKLKKYTHKACLFETISLKDLLIT